jgi:predicted ribosome quality control (RQC) complex YloA/Tae2 family protein
MSDHNLDEEKLAEELRRVIEETFSSSDEIQQLLRQIEEKGFQMMLAVVVSQVRTSRERKAKPPRSVSEMFSRQTRRMRDARSKLQPAESPPQLKLTDDDRRFLRSLNLYFPDEETD